MVDAERMAEASYKEWSVDELRKVITNLYKFKYHGVVKGKRKMKIWSQRPAGYPATLPFGDPKNGKKMSKDDLLKMFLFLKSSNSGVKTSNDTDVTGLGIEQKENMKDLIERSQIEVRKEDPNTSLTDVVESLVSDDEVIKFFNLEKSDPKFIPDFAVRKEYVEISKSIEKQYASVPVKGTDQSCFVAQFHKPVLSTKENVEKMEKLTRGELTNGVKTEIDEYSVASKFDYKHLMGSCTKLTAMKDFYATLRNMKHEVKKNVATHAAEANQVKTEARDISFTEAYSHLNVNKKSHYSPQENHQEPVDTYFETTSTEEFQFQSVVMPLGKRGQKRHHTHCNDSVNCSPEICMKISGDVHDQHQFLDGQSYPKKKAIDALTSDHNFHVIREEKISCPDNLMDMFEF